MEFVYPAFFAALAAISIPILIHLFNLRRFKKIVFSNVRLLQSIKFETKAQSKLRHLLILMTRILMIMMLVSAFSLPFIFNDSPKAKVKKENLVSIYIDNSFSMMAKDEDQYLLNISKDKARAIASSYSIGTKFQLITNEFNSSEQYFIDKEQLTKELELINSSGVFRTISAVAKRQRDLLPNQGNASINAYLISDFQSPGLDLTEFPDDSTINFYFLPTQPTTYNNIYIDSCWFETPIRQYGAMEELHVRIRNDNDEDFEEIPLKLYINNKQKTPAIVDLPANSSHDITLNFVNNNYGIQNGKIVLRDYPVTFDDQFYFNYHVDSLINVLCINGGEESKSLKALFSNEGFRFQNLNENQIDFSNFSQQHVIILNALYKPSSGLIQELQKYAKNETSIVIIPPHDLQPENYSEFLNAFNLPSFGTLDTANSVIASLNVNSLLFNNVFKEIPRNISLPKVSQHYKLVEKGFREREVLMSLKNQDDFLIHYRTEQSSVYLFTTPLSKTYSNFSAHSIFVPTFYNIALYSQKKLPLFYTIGLNTSIEGRLENNSENVFHLKNEETDIIPETQLRENQVNLYFHNQLKQDGNYRLYAENSNDTSGIAFNYNRKESQLKGPNVTELKDELDSYGLKNVKIFEAEAGNNLAAIVSFNDQGKSLWKYCIILALLFLCVEMLLIRLWK